MHTGQIPEGLDVPSDLHLAALDLREGLTARPAPTAARLRALVRTYQQAHNDAGASPRLRVDGAYGPATRGALAADLGTDVASQPPARTQTTPRTSTSSPVDPSTEPAWLRPAVALAKWTQQAVAQDSTAARYLASLRSNATYIAARTNAPRTGARIGYVPPEPDASDVASWADAAWQRVTSEGAAARAALDSHAQGLIDQAERALRDVRAQLDRETDTAVREALRILEATLTAILRPLARGIRTATSGLALPALVLGAGLLLMSRRRAA